MTSLIGWTTEHVTPPNQRARLKVPGHDPQMLAVALEAIRCLAQGRVKNESSVETPPDGVVEIAYAGTGVSEMCAADDEGPINKKLLDDILHETKDRSFSRCVDHKACLSALNLAENAASLCLQLLTV